MPEKKASEEASLYTGGSFCDDDPGQPPLFRWRAHAHLLYENWLNYYVYQNTPYDLGAISKVEHEEE